MSERPSWRFALLLALAIVGVVCSGCFAVQRDPAPTADLPDVVFAAGGPVQVVRTWPVLVHGDSAWGSYDPATRTILIDSLAPAAHQRRVLEHELVHAALDDAGLAELLEPAMQEALAQAISAQRLAAQDPRWYWRASP